jgi:hypothetical protein
MVERLALKHANARQARGVLLHASIRGRRGGGDGHQPEALQQKNSTLRCAAPDELATVALAILNVDVSTAVFQTAILENAINEDAFVQNHVLVFERLAVVSIHTL